MRYRSRFYIASRSFSVLPDAKELHDIRVSELGHHNCLRDHLVEMGKASATCACVRASTVFAHAKKKCSNASTSLVYSFMMTSKLSLSATCRIMYGLKLCHNRRFAHTTPQTTTQYNIAPHTISRKSLVVSTPLASRICQRKFVHHSHPQPCGPEPLRRSQAKSPSMPERLLPVNCNMYRCLLD